VASPPASLSGSHDAVEVKNFALSRLPYACEVRANVT
jgi:hypothetical protein